MATSVRNHFVKLLVFLLLAVGVVGYLGVHSPAFADDTVTVGIDVVYDQTGARSMLADVNAFRASDDAWYWANNDVDKVVMDDLSPYVYDYDLERVAMQRAAEIAVRFDHERPSGKVTWTAYDEHAGSVFYWTMGENIAAGQRSVSSAMLAWREDNDNYDGQGHRRSMLSDEFNAIGIAHAVYQGRDFWVQEFGKRTSSSTACDALDDAKTVQIDVAQNNVGTVSVAAKPSEITLVVGQTSELPSIEVTALLWGTQCVLHVPPASWSIGAGGIASLSGDSIRGVKCGSSELLAEVDACGTRRLSVPVSVGENTIEYATVTLASSNYSYSGSAIEPGVTVVLGGVTLNPDIDYDVSFKDNVNAGTAKAIVLGKGAYAGGVKERAFTISPITLNRNVVRGYYNSSVTYNGKIQNPVLYLLDGSTSLVFGKDYEGDFFDGDGISAGTMTAQIHGIGNYKDVWAVSVSPWAFEIKPLDLSSSNVKIEVIDDEVTYDGSEKMPEISVTVNGNALPVSDYSVSYSNNVNAGKGNVTITAASGNVTGSKTGTFSIAPIDLEMAKNLEISGEGDFTYTGSEIAPNIKVSLNGSSLVANRDYTIGLENNVDAGDARVTIVGQGNYSGTVPRLFSIAQRDINDASITIADIADQYGSDGDKPSPAIKMMHGSKALQLTSDYTTSYSYDYSAGTGLVTISGTGNYCGTRTKSFKLIANTPDTPDTPQSPDNPPSPTNSAKDSEGKSGESGDQQSGQQESQQGSQQGKQQPQDVQQQGNKQEGQNIGQQIVETPKADNPLMAKPKAKTLNVKASKLKKKARSFAKSKVFAITGAQGPVTFAVEKYDKKAKKKISVDSSGKLKVSKGVKKGTYTLKVSVTAAGNEAFDDASVTVTLKVKVK